MNRSRFLKVAEFLFDPQKSAWLKEERGLGFEEIIHLLGQEELVEVFPHPSLNYRHQFICELVVDDYVYIVPFIVDGDKVFLKTLFPSRKATKRRRTRS
ncbi:MAG: toxin [Alphaproteobacteria bacterium]|nr:toxin [Alphaproteobacteria bacterium]